MKCKKGYKRQGNKCVKNSSNSKSRRKKSINPFKMWESYVGMLLMLVLFINYSWSCMTYAIREDRIGSSFFKEIFNINGANCTSFSVGILVFIIIWLGLGFLIGWVLTLIWRKIRK